MKPLEEISASVSYGCSESEGSVHGIPLLIKPLLKPNPENSCVEMVQKFDSTLNCCVDDFERGANLFCGIHGRFFSYRPKQY